MLDRPVLDRLVAQHHEPLAREFEPQQHLGERRLGEGRRPQLPGNVERGRLFAVGKTVFGEPCFPSG
jgi:hypothetical protein